MLNIRFERTVLDLDIALPLHNLRNLLIKEEILPALANQQAEFFELCDLTDVLWLRHQLKTGRVYGLYDFTLFNQYTGNGPSLLGNFAGTLAISGAGLNVEAPAFQKQGPSGITPLDIYNRRDAVLRWAFVSETVPLVSENLYNDPEQDYQSHMHTNSPLSQLYNRIYPGDLPSTNPYVALALELVEDWLETAGRVKAHKGVEEAAKRVQERQATFESLEELRLSAVSALPDPGEVSSYLGSIMRLQRYGNALHKIQVLDRDIEFDRRYVDLDPDEAEPTLLFNFEALNAVPPTPLPEDRTEWPRLPRGNRLMPATLEIFRSFMDRFNPDFDRGRWHTEHVEQLRKDKEAMYDSVISSIY